MDLHAAALSSLPGTVGSASMKKLDWDEPGFCHDGA